MVLVSLGKAKPRPSKVFVTDRRTSYKKDVFMNHDGINRAFNKLTPLTTFLSNVTVGLSVMNVPSTTGTNTYVP